MKITKEMQRDIIAKSLKAAFGAAEEKIKERQSELCRRVRDAIIGRKNAEVVDSLPDGYFSMRGNFSVQLTNEKDEKIDFAQLYYEKVRMPLLFDHSVQIISQRDQSRIVAAIQKWIEDDKELRQAKEAFKAKTRGVIMTCGTDKKLLEHWPTLGTLMGEGYFAPPPATKLPVTTINELDVTLKAGMKAAA